VNHLGDVAQLGGLLGEGVDRLARGDVDALGADAVAEVLQCGGGRRLVVLADVGEEDVLAGALAASDGLADAAGDDEDVVVLVMSDLSVEVLGCQAADRKRTYAVRITVARSGHVVST
jgi:hypothetical protein